MICLNDCEIRYERAYYGNDKRAINRHSVRKYLVPGHDSHIYLDRTLDTCPKLFELYWFVSEYQKGGCNIAIPILVEGQRYFAGDFTWKQAVKLAERAIEKWFEENE